MSESVFVQWCESLGYTIEEAMPCVVSKDAATWSVNLASGFFPTVPKQSHVRVLMAMQPSAIHCGPGTELHALLGRFGLTDSGDCKCKSRVSYMNKMEADSPGWCAEHEDEIVGWLRESAADRSLPFLDWPARLLIRRAIANARRKDAARAEGSPHHDRREEVAPPRDAPQG